MEVRSWRRCRRGGSGQLTSAASISGRRANGLAGSSGAGSEVRLPSPGLVPGRAE